MIGIHRKNLAKLQPFYECACRFYRQTGRWQSLRKGFRLLTAVENIFQNTIAHQDSGTPGNRLPRVATRRVRIHHTSSSASRWMWLLSVLLHGMVGALMVWMLHDPVTILEEQVPTQQASLSGVESRTDFAPFLSSAPEAAPVPKEEIQESSEAVIPPVEMIDVTAIAEEEIKSDSDITDTLDALPQTIALAEHVLANDRVEPLPDAQKTEKMSPLVSLPAAVPVSAVADVEAIKPVVPVESPAASTTLEAAPERQMSQVTPAPHVPQASWSPSIIYRQEPIYPRSARRLGQEGTVRIAVNIVAAGSVHDARVAQSSGIEALDTAALVAVRTWRFMPRALGDIQQTTEVLLTIVFRLEG